MNEEAKILHNSCWQHSHIGGDGIVWKEYAWWGGGAIVRMSEENKFSFGALQGKASPGKPVVCRRVVCLEGVLNVSPGGTKAKMSLSSTYRLRAVSCQAEKGEKRACKGRYDGG